MNHHHHEPQKQPLKRKVQTWTPSWLIQVEKPVERGHRQLLYSRSAPTTSDDPNLADDQAIATRFHSVLSVEEQFYLQNLGSRYGSLGYLSTAMPVLEGLNVTITVN